MVTICLIGPKPNEQGGVVKAMLYQASLYKMLGHNVIWLDTKNLGLSILKKCDILHVHNTSLKNILLILVRKPRKLLTLHGWILDEARTKVSMSSNISDTLKNLLFYIYYSITWLIHKVILIPFIYNYVVAVSHITAKKNNVRALVVPNPVMCRNINVSNSTSDELIFVTYISIGGGKISSIPRLLKIMYSLNTKLEKIGIKRRAILKFYGKDVPRDIARKLSEYFFIKFMGYVDDYVEELKTADLFLAGYTFPELGYTALEAMCVGVPVAKFTEKPELEEIIDGFNGILAETDQEMIEKLTNYILNMGEMKKELSTNARNTIVKRRCPSRIAIAWKIILRALTS